MTRYSSEAEAAAAGIKIEHDEANQRFVLVREVGRQGNSEAAGGSEGPVAAEGSSETAARSREAIGEAHYSLLGDARINFDHTFVTPKFRGTGLSDLLAEHALTSVVVEGRSILASCWFISDYLAEHPHFARTAE